MTRLVRGQKLDILGPLGNGFTLLCPSPPGNIALIGGGVGIVSLYPLAEVLGTAKLFIFTGGRSKKDVLCVEDFKKLSPRIFIATEDGSLGFKGTVVDLFLSEKRRRETEFSYIYSCGPFEMLKALAKTLKKRGLTCQGSFESRMACGFGACWGCVIKTNHPDSPYQRVCKEGPVFSLDDINWEGI